MINKFTLSLLFVFIKASVGLAQSPGHIPLVDVLDSLEQKYAVKFTYADMNIRNVTLSQLPSSATLNQCIEALEDQTTLIFEVLNERFIAISKGGTKGIDVCGIVTDATSGEALEGAAVFTSGHMALTDAKGGFSIDGAVLGDTATIQFFGYYPKKIPLDRFLGSGCPKVTLVPNVTILNEVTVQNFLIKGIDKKADGSFSINLPATEILPGLTEPDVLHTIQKLPGIQSINETVSNINVRGGANDQNLVLWDGVKMYQTGHFFGLISAFNPFLVENVTLIKNGTPARYNEGVSSTIVIETYDEIKNSLEAGAGINMINGDVYFKWPISKKLALHFSSRRSFADATHSPTFSNYFDRAFRGTEVAQFVNGADTLSTNENFFFYDYSGKLLYDISKKDKLRISVLKVYNQVKYEERGLVNNTLEVKNSALSQSDIAGAARYQRKWRKGLNTNLSLDVSAYNLRSINFDIPNAQRFLQENKVLDLTAHAGVEWQMSNLLKLTLGYQFNEIGIDNLDDLNNPTFKRSIKEVVRAHSQFTEVHYTSRSGLTLGNLGLRANYFEKFDRWRFEPRLSINQLLGSHFTLELLAELKSQVTTQIIDFQTDFLGVEKRRWVLVNDKDIPLITSSQISLGMHYQKENMLISLEGYVKRVRGIITSSQGFQNQLQFVRTSGDYTSRGIDVLANNRLGRFNVWGSYSYAVNNYAFQKLTPPVFPSNLDITHTSTVGISYLHRGLEISTGLNYHTGRPITKPDPTTPIVAGDINYQRPNSSRMGEYLRPDFSMKYSFKINKVINAQVGGSLWNFIDQSNEVNRYYTINNDGRVQQVNELALGLTPNFMVRVSF